MNAIALSFQDTQFEAVDRNNQPWLRGYQIGSALGYSRPDVSIPQLFDRNKSEFTDQMTALVELDTNGGKQQVRIFSLRGCHLLAMFARTPVAKEFRRWVLDILEKHGEESAPERPTKKALSGCLTAEQQDIIKEMVKARADGLPKSKQAKSVISGWAAIKSKFGCTYKAIPEEEFLNVVALLERLPIEGELLPLEDDPLLAPDVRSAIEYRTQVLTMRQYEHIKAQVQAYARRVAPMASQNQPLAELIKGCELPDSKLVFVRRDDLWRMTQQVAQIASVMDAVHKLEESTGMEWYGR